MTDKKKSPRRNLAREILGIIALCAAISFVLFVVLSVFTNAVAEMYCFDNDIPMTEFDWIDLSRTIITASAAIACCCFSVLFLFMMRDRIEYIRKITAGIDSLRGGEQNISIPLEYNNDLTELAAAINYMSATQQKIREKELTLAREKEELIHTLSHDIRTPLTSILAYSDYLNSKGEISPDQQKAYMQLIEKKANQIKELTAILLDSGRRSVESFDHCHLLFEQIVMEFEETLEDSFEVAVDLSACWDFAGSFDVQELRRIFDNLSSNIQKYADRNTPVTLSVSKTDEGLFIRQTNGVLKEKTDAESYGIGLNSIRRIAQLYGGRVTAEEKDGQFAIEIALFDF